MALTVHLSALINNYHICAAQAAGACGAVIKANAYGLGVAQLYPALRLRTDCQWFFVAYPQEALHLRELEQSQNLPPARIVVMNGLCGHDPRALADAGIYPAINHWEDLHAWQRCAITSGRTLPAVLQVDTGMHRNGITPEGAKSLAQADGVDWQLLMTHYACADTPDHPLNRQQLQVFEDVWAHFPNVPTSIANSAGIWLGGEFCGDVARPGIGLYGGQPSDQYHLPLQPVVSLSAPIIQLQDIKAGDTVGYGASFVADQPMRIATLQIGYADGLHRHHSNRGHFYLAEYPVLVIGRISMDVCNVDVSAVPGHLIQLGALIEIIGPHRTLEQHALDCGTINYGVLTGLKPRLPIVYVG